MSDLISRQAALDIIDSELNGWLTDEERSHLERVEVGIACLPTIDPVKHGEWIAVEYNDGTVRTECSVCGYGRGLPPVRNYCPNCGARMDG